MITILRISSVNRVFPASCANFFLVTSRPIFLQKQVGPLELLLTRENFLSFSAQWNFSLIAFSNNFAVHLIFKYLEKKFFNLLLDFPPTVTASPLTRVETEDSSGINKSNTFQNQLLTSKGSQRQPNSQPQLKRSVRIVKLVLAARPPLVLKPGQQRSNTVLASSRNATAATPKSNSLQIDKTMKTLTNFPLV